MLLANNHLPGKNPSDNNPRDRIAKKRITRLQVIHLREIRLLGRLLLPLARQVLQRRTLFSVFRCIRAAITRCWQHVTQALPPQVQVLRHARLRPSASILRLLSSPRHPYSRVHLLGPRQWDNLLTAYFVGPIRRVLSPSSWKQLREWRRRQRYRPLA